MIVSDVRRDELRVDVFQVMIFGQVSHSTNTIYCCYEVIDNVVPDRSFGVGLITGILPNPEAALAAFPTANNGVVVDAKTGAGREDATVGRAVGGHIDQVVVDQDSFQAVADRA